MANKQKTIKVQTPKGELSAKFKQPTKLIYKVALDLLDIKNDKFSALESFFKSTVIGDEYKEDFEVQAIFFPELLTEFFKFDYFDVNRDGDMFIITINEKEIKVKSPNRDQFKKIFNTNMVSKVEAIDLVFEELVQDADNVNISLKEYLSLREFPTILLFNKELDLKKK
jgi:hypothetical protein